MEISLLKAVNSLNSKIMKKNSLIMIFLLIPLVGFTQNTNVNIYKNIYRYLTNNDLKNYKNVNVSNEIVFIEYSSFIGKGLISKIDSLNELDNRIKFKPYFISNLNRIIRTKKSFYNILYFSEPHNGFLIVDFIHRKRKIVGNYDKITMFGNLKRYLFKISNSKVEKVLVMEMANN